MSQSVFERGLVFPSGFRESALRSSSPGRSPEPISPGSACESRETSLQSNQIRSASVSSSLSSQLTSTAPSSLDLASSNELASQQQMRAGSEPLQDPQSTSPSTERLGSIPSVFSVTLMYPDTAPRGAWRPQLDSYLKRQSVGRSLRQSPTPYSRPCSPASLGDKFDLKLPSLSGTPSKYTSSPSEHTISAYTDQHESTAVSVASSMNMDARAGMHMAPASPRPSVSGADALSDFANAAASYGHYAFPGKDTSQASVDLSVKTSACRPVEPTVKSLYFQVAQQPPTPSASTHSSSSCLTQNGSEASLESLSVGKLHDDRNLPFDHTNTSTSNTSQRLSLSIDRVGVVRSIPSPPSSPVVRGQIESTKTCISCRSSHSPCWRPSWSQAAGQLCNSCGLRYKKTGARCLSASCNKIPCKGEFSLMLRTAQRDSSGQPIFACLKCTGPIEVRRD